MNEINDTLDYGKAGFHKNKCEICGGLYDESNDLNDLLISGPAQCPDCEKILKLRTFLEEQSKDLFEKERQDPIFMKNIWLDEPYDSNCGAEFERTYEFVDAMTSKAGKRTKTVNELIDRIYNARKYVYYELEPYVEILDSIVEDNYTYWKTSGNFVYYVYKAAFDYLVTQINELIGKKSKLSLGKIENIINNEEKADAYRNLKIISVITFKKSGDQVRVEIPEFPIDEFLALKKDVMADYKDITDAMKDYRDNKVAHISDMKNEEAVKQNLTVRKLRRVFNSIKLIYDGLAYSIAPDKYSHLVMNFQLGINYVDNAVRFCENNWKKQFDKEE